LFELNFKNLNYVIWTIFISCFLPFIYTNFLEFKSHGTAPPPSPLVKTDIYSLCCISLAWMVPNHFHTCFWCETLCNGWLSPISHAHCFCCLLCVSVYASSSSLWISSYCSIKNPSLLKRHSQYWFAPCSMSSYNYYKLLRCRFDRFCNWSSINHQIILQFLLVIISSLGGLRKKLPSLGQLRKLKTDPLLPP